MGNIDYEVVKNAILSSYKRRYEYAKIRNRYDYRFGAGIVAVSVKELCTELEFYNSYPASFADTQALSINQVTPDEMNALCKDAHDIHELLATMVRACFIDRERFHDAYAQGNLLIMASGRGINKVIYLSLARPLLEATGTENGVECTTYLYVSDTAGMRGLVAYDALQPAD